MKIKVKLDPLDDPAEISKIDQSGMLGLVLQLPKMLLEALALAQKIKLKKLKKIKQLIVAGMGGSAISGDIASDLLREKSSLPLLVNRDYSLPGFVGQETLFFALSYSGNTEETLLAVQEAAKRGAKIICITSGGNLWQLAQQQAWPVVLIPGGLQPRAALPWLLVPLLVCLNKIGYLGKVDQEIKAAAEMLNQLAKEWGTPARLRYNPVKQLAKKLLNQTPIILANVGTTEAVGRRLQTQFNENSKSTAMLSLFPELNHNEIVNLTSLKKGQHNFACLLLRDEADLERTKKRIEITKSIIGTHLSGINEIVSRGKTPLAKILSLIYFGDLLSVYLALAKGIDPTPVEAIVKLKKELGR